MLTRFIFFTALKYAFALTLILVGILQIYLIGDSILSGRVFFELFLWSLPVFLFYAMPFVASISCILVLRSLQKRRLDLAFSGFGMSPLRLALYFAPIGALLTLFSFIIALQTYPYGQSRLSISQKPGGIIKDLWLVQKFPERTLFYHFGIVDLSTGKVYDASVLELKDYVIKSLVQSKEGVWLGDSLKLNSARVLDLLSGQESVKDLSYSYVVLERVGQLAKRPEELSMGELILLSSVGKKVGLNHRQFLKEATIRVLNSLAVFVCSFICIAFGISFRSWRFSLLVFFIIFTFHWLLLNIFSTLLEKTNVSFGASIIIYTPILGVLGLSLYYLRKLHRV
ncbi:MAG: LptF/LptG family permease [Aquificaceae bacterium]